MPRLSHAERLLCADAFEQWLRHAEQLKQAGQWNGHTGCCYFSERIAPDTFARADGDGKVQLYRHWRGEFNLVPEDFLDKATAAAKRTALSSCTNVDSHAKGSEVLKISRPANLASPRLQSAATSGGSHAKYIGLSKPRPHRSLL